jgi:hypothetical protein
VICGVSINNDTIYSIARVDVSGSPVLLRTWMQAFPPSSQDRG